MSTIYSYDCYKKYLCDLAGDPKRRSGLKGEMAEAIGCQSSYVSRVLKNKAEFSLEQGDALAGYLALHGDEKKYLLLLISYARAGTSSLRAYYKSDLNRMQSEQKEVKSRIPESGALNEKAQQLYYSDFYYTAIHMACTIPNLNSLSGLSHCFSLDKTRVVSYLDTLISLGLLKKKEDHYETTLNSVFIENSNLNSNAHHLNVRLKAIESLKKKVSEVEEKLHYSAVVTVSKKDRVLLRNQLLNVISEFVATVKKSKEEELCVFSMDFFRV